MQGHPVTKETFRSCDLFKDYLNHSLQLTWEEAKVAYASGQKATGGDQPATGGSQPATGGNPATGGFVYLYHEQLQTALTMCRNCPGRKEIVEAALLCSDSVANPVTLLEKYETDPNKYQ